MINLQKNIEKQTEIKYSRRSADGIADRLLNVDRRITSIGGGNVHIGQCACGTTHGVVNEKEEPASGNGDALVYRLRQVCRWLLMRVSMSAE